MSSDQILTVWAVVKRSWQVEVEELETEVSICILCLSAVLVECPSTSPSSGFQPLRFPFRSEFFSSGGVSFLCRRLQDSISWSTSRSETGCRGAAEQQRHMNSAVTCCTQSIWSLPLLITGAMVTVKAVHTKEHQWRQYRSQFCLY